MSIQISKMDEEILEQILNVDLPYALLRSFIGVLEQRAKEYEENYPDVKEILEKLLKDTELFVASMKHY